LTGKRRDYPNSYTENEAGCWIYTGSINNKGYGTILGKAAHRWFYAHYVGPIPEGYQIDHLCKTKACVNPKHLEPVTPRVNWERSECGSRLKSLQTHCIYGHELLGENLITWLRNGNPQRECAACRTPEGRANILRVRMAA